jgi:hypothetical protein
LSISDGVVGEKDTIDGKKKEQTSQKQKTSERTNSMQHQLQKQVLIQVPGRIARGYLVKLPIEEIIRHKQSMDKEGPEQDKQQQGQRDLQHAR